LIDQAINFLFFANCACQRRNNVAAIGATNANESSATPIFKGKICGAYGDKVNEVLLQGNDEGRKRSFGPTRSVGDNCVEKFSIVVKRPAPLKNHAPSVFL
jgi:hypothetical protein